MTDSEFSQAESIVSKDSDVVASLDNVKAFFYLYNAKPDTEIRFLKDGKIVGLADIRSIEERVAAKLGNHDVLGQTVAIAFTLSSTKLKEFSTWAEFEREQWSTVNEKVESLAISWNVLIRLPQYKSPQTHSMKLRIGNSIPPKDLFQLLLTSDDVSEVMEARSPGVCKVDFINAIVANELLFIVDEWYKGLRKSPEPDTVQRFLRKHGKTASQAIRLFSPLLLLSIACTYTDHLYLVLGVDQELSIDNLQRSLVFLLAVFMLGSFFGSIIEKSIDRKIDKLEEYPSFLISKGDENAVEEFQRKNKKLTSQIFSRILWLLFSIPISSAIKFLINYLLNLEK